MTNGFTFIEILVVMGILVTILSLGLFVSLDAYRGYSSRVERDAIVSILERARSRAMANIDQSSWGVCMIDGDYVLFPGTACVSGAAGNEVISASRNAVAVFSTPIIFSQLAATTTGGVIMVTQNDRKDSITVNNEGRIDW